MQFINKVVMALNGSLITIAKSGQAHFFAGF